VIVFLYEYFTVYPLSTAGEIFEVFPPHRLKGTSPTNGSTPPFPWHRHSLFVGQRLFPLTRAEYFRSFRPFAPVLHASFACNGRPSLRLQSNVVFPFVGAEASFCLDSPFSFTLFDILLLHRVIHRQRGIDTSFNLPHALQIRSFCSFRQRASPPSVSPDKLIFLFKIRGTSPHRWFDDVFLCGLLLPSAVNLFICFKIFSRPILNFLFRGSPCSFFLWLVPLYPLLMILKDKPIFILCARPRYLPILSARCSASFLPFPLRDCPWM